METLSNISAGALRIHVITLDNPSESDAANNVFEATVQSMEKKEEEKLVFIQLNKIFTRISRVNEIMLEYEHARPWGFKKFGTEKVS